MIAIPLALAAAAATPPTSVNSHFRPGVYRSFFVHRETGDDLGMELELHLGADAHGFFTLCEGVCSPIRRVPIAVDGDRLHFTYVEPLVDPDGKPAPPAVLRFTATRRGDRLVVRLDGGDGAPDVLKPIPARHALALAAVAPPPVRYAPQD